MRLSRRAFLRLSSVAGLAPLAARYLSQAVRQSGVPAHISGEFLIPPRASPLFDRLQFPGYKGLNLPWGTSRTGEEIYSTWLTTGWDPAAAAADLDIARSLGVRFLRAFLFLDSFFVSPGAWGRSPAFGGIVGDYLANFNRWLDLCAERDLHPIVCFSDGTQRRTSDHVRGPGGGRFDHRALFGRDFSADSPNLLPNPLLEADPFAAGHWRAVDSDGGAPRNCAMTWQPCAPTPAGAAHCITLTGRSGDEVDGLAESAVMPVDVNRCYAFTVWLKGHIHALRLKYYAADGVTPLKNGALDRERHLVDGSDWIILNHAFQDWTPVTITGRYPEHYPHPEIAAGGTLFVRVGVQQAGAGLSGAMTAPNFHQTPGADASIRSAGWQDYLRAYQELLNTAPPGGAIPFKDDRRIFAWEVMNEPNDKLAGMGRTVVHGFMRDAYRAIKAVDSLHPVTAEFASGAPNKGAGWVEAYGRDTSDFYQIHQYADAPGWRWPEADARGLSRPVIVGEFGASNSNPDGTRHYLREDYQAEVVREVLQGAAERGYAAALVWSLSDLTNGHPNNPMADHAADGSHSLQAAGAALRDTPSAVVSDVRIERDGEVAVVTFHTDTPALGQVAWASETWWRRYGSRLRDRQKRIEAYPFRAAMSDPSAATTEHRFTIRGLSPETRYFFAIQAQI